MATPGPQTTAETDKRTCILDWKWDLSTMVSQIPEIHIKHYLPTGQGVRTRRSFTTKWDVNLQPEITSVVCGVGKLKRKERNKDQWVPANTGRGRGIHTAWRNLQDYQVQCVALLDLLTAAMMDVPHQ